MSSVDTTLDDSYISTLSLILCGQDAVHDNEQFLAGGPHELCTDAIRDPTERLAAQLGLDWYLLSHKTGLVGTDANGAISRLRFMLAHSGQQEGYTNPPRHQSQTKSSALKQQPAHRVCSYLIEPPEPTSPHEQQARFAGSPQCNIILFHCFV